MLPTPCFGKRLPGETADDLSGARRLRGIAPYGFRVVCGDWGPSGVQMETRRLVPHTGCVVGGAHRIRRMGVSTHATGELATTSWRRSRLSDRVYRALSSSVDLPCAAYSRLTTGPWASGLGVQSRNLLAHLAPFLRKSTD